MLSICTVTVQVGPRSRSKVKRLHASHTRAVSRQCSENRGVMGKRKMKAVAEASDIVDVEEPAAAAAAPVHPRVARANEQISRSRSAKRLRKDGDGEEGAAEEEGEAAAAAAAEAEPEGEVIGRKVASPRWVNRQRTLVFSSRGVSYRSRHLITDLRALMPHSKKDAKMDRKDKLHETIPEICEMKNCNNCIYFEARKKADLYMWVGKLPHGPTAKFQVENVHTMSELKMAGNGLKGSRPILNFDSKFDEIPQLQLLKEMFIQTFGTPRAHPKSKPFVDRVMSFVWLDNRIWFRNYQAVWSDDPKNPDDHELSEIGPRMVLNPIRIFAGTFGGPTLWENELYISPNDARRAMKVAAAQKFRDRQSAMKRTEDRKARMVYDKDEVEDTFRDA